MFSNMNSIQTCMHCREHVCVCVDGGFKSNKAQQPMWVEVLAVPPVCFPEIRAARSQGSRWGLGAWVWSRAQKALTPGGAQSFLMGPSELGRLSGPSPKTSSTFGLNTELWSPAIWTELHFSSLSVVLRLHNCPCFEIIECRTGELLFG